MTADSTTRQRIRTDEEVVIAVCPYLGFGRRSNVNSRQVVFLLDVDNTLLDNDAVTQDLMRHLEREVGRERQQRYWAIFEQLRTELGYADYLGALQRYRIEYPRDRIS